MTTPPDKPKRWRPWQFSIRTLLLLVVGAYLGGWMSNDWQRQRELERARQEERALDEKDFNELVDRVAEMIESVKDKQQEP